MSAYEVQSEWPSLPFEPWKETFATLHMWMQIVGKIRLALAPMMNHWWQVTLYVTARGLTTSPMPCGTGSVVEIDFDFIDHRVRFTRSDGRSEAFALEPISVAQFYQRVMEHLRRLGVDVTIRTTPSEVLEALPFEEDTVHASYDAQAVHRFWKALVQADRLCKRFRTGFLGKASPTHFFWGGCDLAVTRFSGRLAPTHPGGIPHMPDWATREAYSHEVSSCGFWPGGAGSEAAFYSYAYPEPAGFSDANPGPRAALYNAHLREFILPYEAVRTANDCDAVVLEFFQKTYEAAATLGNWDRRSLERQ